MNDAVIIAIISGLLESSACLLAGAISGWITWKVWGLIARRVNGR